MPIVTKAPVPQHVATTGNTAATAQAAALKMLEGATIDDSKAEVEVGDKPAPATPVVEGEVEAAVEKAPEEEKPLEEEKPKLEAKKEGLPDPLKKSFEALAKEKSDLRAERDSLKAERGELAKYRMLDNAVKNRDAMGVLAAAGLTYKDVVAQVTGGKAVIPDAEEPEAGSSEVQTLRTELEELKNERKAEKFNRNMETLHTKMREAVDPKKYPNLAADPGLVREAHNLLIEHTKKTGSPPGETLTESIQIALEAVEAKEEANVQKIMKRRGLTSAKPAGDTEEAGTKSAVDQPASELGKPSRTLTNSHATTPAKGAGSTAKTPEELRALALKQLEAQG